MKCLPLPKPPNPITYIDGKWWFWDECWVELYGPYETQKIAEMKCKEYCKIVLGDIV